MNGDILATLVDPAVLFFVVGLFIGAIGSNLEIPPPIAKFLSLYLLMAIGFKGGQALGDGGLSRGAVGVLVSALLLALVTPIVWFLFLRRRIDEFDAAAIAATYGSVSAVTFVVASQFAASQGNEAGGYLAVALVIMESPAIVMAVLLSTLVRSRRIAEGSARGDSSAHASVSIKKVLHEAFTDGAHLLLIGSMVVGALTGEDGGKAMAPFTGGIFKGLLAFFLLEMGLLVARQLREVRDVGPFLTGFGVVVPFVNASAAMVLGSIFNMSVGDLTVLAALAASGSYIVVPAVVRYAIPEARPSKYFTLALGVTFPVNVVIGIPVFHQVAKIIAG